MARPGYNALELKELFEIGVFPYSEHHEVVLTARYMRDHDFSLLVSLSDLEHHEKDDVTIQKELAKTAPDVEFVYIPNEDHVDNPSFKKGDGPSLEKFIIFTKLIAQNEEADKKTLVYCGEGIGRTGAYLTAYQMSQGMTLDQAIEHVASSNRRPTFKHELEENGGFEQLQRFQEHLASGA